MDAPPRFDCELARKMLPEGSSFWNPRLNLPLMLAQPVSLCFIIAAAPETSPGRGDIRKRIETPLALKYDARRTLFGGITTWNG